MTERPRTLLQLGLTLLPERKPHEVACLSALSVAASRLDGVLLSAPSWQEEPGALNHSLVVEALARCRDYGLDIYWGRDAFIRWEAWAKANGWLQRFQDVFDPAYWAGYLGTLAAEAPAIGAVGTFAQCEPHGDKTVTAKFKAKGFGAGAWRVVGAIGEARSVMPAVTIAKPAGSANPAHYGYATCNIADQFVCTKPDYARRLSDLDGKINTPDGKPWKFHWWRTSLKSVHNSSPDNRLTVPEWDGMDWAEIQKERSEIKGRVITIGQTDFVAVLNELGGANG